MSKLEHAKESLQEDMSDARAKLAALEARFQQHLAECSGRQAAAAEKEASLELACRHAKAEANIARYTCRSEAPRARSCSAAADVLSGTMLLTRDVSYNSDITTPCTECVT